MALRIQVARPQRLYGMTATQARLIAGLHEGGGAA
jgi:hypothetical protein